MKRHILSGASLLTLMICGCSHYGWADRPREGQTPLAFSRVDVETVRVPPQDRMYADAITQRLIQSLEQCGRGVSARWSAPQPTDTTAAALSCRAHTNTRVRDTMQLHDVDLVCTLRHGARHRTLTRQGTSRTQWDATSSPAQTGGLGLTHAAQLVAQEIACPLLDTMDEEK